MCDPLKAAKDTAVTIVTEVIRAAGDNPDVKEAGQNLGKAALIVTKTINNALLPLAAINFAFDKAKVYFSEKFQNDLSEKASKIPQENIVEPKASIAGPALQGLAFTHDEPNLKNMYLSLLATAMDGRITTKAHPAFVEIIKQLDAEEAEILKLILTAESPLAVAEIQLLIENESQWKTLQKHLLPLEDKKSLQPKENSRVTAIVDNWIRLGLVEVDYDKVLAGEKTYAWVLLRPEFIRYKMQFQSHDTKVAFIRGSMVRTEFGHQFARAVGLFD
jgi:hypothetical protein